MRSKTIIVAATFQARPRKEVELKIALISLVAPTRQEKGCISYPLHASPEDPAKFLFYENWTSKAALDAHMQSAQIKALLPRMDELCVAFPQIALWEKIG